MTILWPLDSLLCFGICKFRILLIFLLLFRQKLRMSLTLLQSVCDKRCLCERVLPFEPLFAVLYIYNMLSRGCLNTHTDIYKELTILIQFSNQWGLQCEKAMFSILVSSIRFWSFFFLGILYQCFRILLCLCFLSICCELGFLFWRSIVCRHTYLHMSPHCHVLMRKQNDPGGSHTDAGSRVLIPGIQCWRILLPHLSSPSELDQDPRSLFKVLYKYNYL